MSSRKPRVDPTIQSSIAAFENEGGAPIKTRGSDSTTVDPAFQSSPAMGQKRKNRTLDVELWLSVAGGIFRDLVEAVRKSADRTRDLKSIEAIHKLVQRKTSHPQQVAVELNSGVATLRGSVGATEARNLVAAIERLPGVDQVIDQLKVRVPQRHPRKHQKLN